MYPQVHLVPHHRMPPHLDGEALTEFQLPARTLWSEIQGVKETRSAYTYSSSGQSTLSHEQQWVNRIINMRVRVRAHMCVCRLVYKY